MADTARASDSPLIRAFTFFEEKCFAGGMFVTLLMTLFISTDAFCRWALGMPIPSGFEITEEYLMPSAFFLAVSAVYARGGHVRVTLLLEHLPGKLSLFIAFVMDLLGLLFSLLLTYGAALATYNAVSNHEYSSSFLQYPLAPAYALALVGFASMSIRIFITLFLQPRSAANKEGT